MAGTSSGGPPSGGAGVLGAAADARRDATSWCAHRKLVRRGCPRVCVSATLTDPEGILRAPPGGSVAAAAGAATLGAWSACFRRRLDATEQGQVALPVSR